MTNPFHYPESTPTPAPIGTPTPAPTPAPIVDPQYAAWLAAQAAPAPVAPPVDPQYAAYLAAQAGPAAPPAPSGDDDPFSGPAPQRPKGPRLQEMYGRLILIRPKKVEEVPSKDPKRAGEMVDRMTADVIVLDGGPINYGGRPEDRPPVPHNQVAQVPYVSADMFVSAVAIISQCRDALERRRQNRPGMVLGRLLTGEKKSADFNAPWLLQEATEPEKEIARAYLRTVDPFS